MGQEFVDIEISGLIPQRIELLILTTITSMIYSVSIRLMSVQVLPSYFGQSSDKTVFCMSVRSEPSVNGGVSARLWPSVRIRLEGYLKARARRAGVIIHFISIISVYAI